MKRVDIFNPDGDDSFEGQSILNGNPTGIANKDVNRYTWTKDIYRKMVGNFWIPQSVDLTTDKITKKNLTEDEDYAVEATLSFLIYLDNFQVANLPNISQYITNPHIRDVISYQAGQEVVHSESYQYILESLYPQSKRDKIYNMWRKNKNLLKRNQSIAKIAQDFLNEQSDYNFKKVLVANLALEGIYFYQGFNFFDQLASRKCLIQTDKIIDYIRNDELTHVGIFVNILKEVGVDDDIVFEVFDEAVESEIKWCSEVYGDKILGISSKSSEDYVRYLADDRLARIGLASRYGSNGVDPYRHITDSKKPQGTRGNFFEDAAITEYDSADSVDGWDDL